MNGWPRWRLSAALFITLWLSGGMAHGAGAPLPFLTVDGTVHATLVVGNTLFVGGEFISINNTGRRSLAAVNLQTGAVNNLWNADINLDREVSGKVYTLALSAGGSTLFVGGDFETVRGIERPNLVAVSVVNGALVGAWNAAPRPDGPVRALATSPDGLTLYVGGEFTAIGAGARAGIASVSAPNGTLLPWQAEIDDGNVRAMALDPGNARLFIGGTFTSIRGESHNRLAALGLANGRALAGVPAVTALDPDDAVNVLLLSAGRLFVGGDFSVLGAQPRANLAALDLGPDAIALSAWAPDVIGAVHALAQDPERTRLYVGGRFLFVGGAARDNLAALRTDGADVAVDLLDWNPAPDDRVDTLTLVPSRDELYVGGLFERAGGVDREGFAVFNIARPLTITDPPAGGQQVLGAITLSCEDRSGAGCARICYTLAPQGDPDICLPAEPPVVVAPAAGDVTTLRFHAEDADGNRELLRSERFAIDTEAPQTAATPQPLPDDAWFGAGNVAPVALDCADNHLDLGCTTYYTLDGSEPTTSSQTYIGPIPLAAFLPPATIPPDEVDPLLHLADIFTLRFFSVDDAGNVEAPRRLSYRIDLAAPVVTPSLPSGTYVRPTQISLDCDDGNGSGCREMYYTLNAAPPSDGTVLDANGNPIAATARYEGPLTLGDATTLTVLAIDNAGNTSSRIVGFYAFSDPARETRSGVGSMDLAWLLALALLLVTRRPAGRGKQRGQ